MVPRSSRKYAARRTVSFERLECRFALAQIFAGPTPIETFDAVSSASGSLDDVFELRDRETGALIDYHEFSQSRSYSLGGGAGDQVKAGDVRDDVYGAASNSAATAGGSEGAWEARVAVRVDNYELQRPYLDVENRLTASVTGSAAASVGPYPLRLDPDDGEQPGQAKTLDVTITINGYNTFISGHGSASGSYLVRLTQWRDEVELDEWVVIGSLPPYNPATFGAFNIEHQIDVEARIGDEFDVTLVTQLAFGATDGTCPDFEHCVAPIAPSATMLTHIDLREAAETGPDLTPKAVTWHRAEEGGGLTLDIDSSQELDSQTVDVRLAWANAQGQDLGPIIAALPVTFSDAGIRSVRVSNEQLWESRIERPYEATHLLVHLDPEDDFFEAAEDNNELLTPLFPLTVVVATHGFNPEPDDLGFMDPWYDLGRQFRAMPGDGSALLDRVAPFVLPWDSITGFQAAFAGLVSAYIADAAADAEQATMFPNPVRVFGLRALASSLRVVAAISSGESRAIAETTVNKMLDLLTATGEYLLPDHRASVQQQRIVLVGHSRGAALNAELSSRLSMAGYGNVADYVSLDGFSTDWPEGAGAIADFDIVSSVVADQRLNYRVDQPLGAFVVDNPESPVNELLHFLAPHASLGVSPAEIFLGEGIAARLRPLELRAPLRAGFDERCLINPGIVLPSQHVNARQIYASSEARSVAERRYIFEQYVGANMFAGTEPPAAGSPLPDSFDDAPCQPQRGAGPIGGEGEPGNPIGRPELGFRDGTVDDLAQILLDAANNPLTQDDEEYLNVLLAAIRDPWDVARFMWRTSGDVQVVDWQSDPALGLRQTSDTTVAQHVLLPQRAASVDFDLEVESAGIDDALEVWMDDQLLGSINLLSGEADGFQTLALPATLPYSATFDFRLRGPETDPAVGRVAHLAVAGRPTHAPQLFEFSPSLPDVVRYENDGVAVPELLAGFVDLDNDTRPGLAIVAAPAPDIGQLQFSLDAGRSWQPVGAVSQTHALLLDAQAGVRIRLAPSGERSGLIDALFEFRAWDHSNEPELIMGDYADTSESGGTSAFSLSVDRAQVVIDLEPAQFAWHNADEPLDVDVDGHIAPRDALLIINELNAGGSRILSAFPEPPDAPPPFLDTSADGHLSPIDALLVINHLNATSGAEGESIDVVVSPWETWLRPRWRRFAPYPDTSAGGR